ncbi:hypothetical protein H0H92_000313, partial [Tricholoma furcatifolium]
MASDSSALNSDGTLKDASQINWYFDPDDKVALPAAPSSTAVASSAVPLHPFFTGSKTSAVSIEGARRSIRVVKPSQ